ncbi:hypothetical protein YT1_4351 [Rhodococcus ruber]|nr:hypothetical protein YT1_4351 [Rhodococcus ruber]
MHFQPPQAPAGMSSRQTESRPVFGLPGRTPCDRLPGPGGPVAARDAHDRRLPGHRSGPVPDSHRLPDYPREGHLDCLAGAESNRTG